MQTFASVCQNTTTLLDKRPILKQIHCVLFIEAFKGVADDVFSVQQSVDFHQFHSSLE